MYTLGKWENGLGNVQVWTSLKNKRTEFSFPSHGHESLFETYAAEKRNST